MSLELSKNLSESGRQSCLSFNYRNSLLCLFFFLFGAYSTFLIAASAGLGRFLFSAHGG